MVENLDNFNFNLIFFSDQPQYSVNLQLMEKSIYVWHLVIPLLEGSTVSANESKGSVLRKNIVCYHHESMT